MSITRHHNDWLSLVPNSGPFLSLPVLVSAFPQGLDAHDADHARRLRMALEEWDDDQSGRRPDPKIHREWIKFVLGETQGFDELLVEGQAIPQTLKSDVAEYGETLRPDWIVNDPATKKARLLVQVYPRSQSLTKPVQTSRWKTSPDTRMMQLLHDTGIRLGIVTNGEHWMLVNAPKNETTGFVSWYANLWLEEPVTLRALRTLVSADRFFSVPENETLEALLDKSAADQQEVTDQLGYQVRKAVEVLIQALDKADQDHGRKLLADVDEKVLYESALTVMMRLVFLFCAEERELLLLGDDLYDKNYAVSTLREQLQAAVSEHSEDILGLRYDAWTRLLTAFRAVYAGVKHDRLKLPAYGGSLFNPDRFPFLEGRKAGTGWKDTEATPLPVSNRTVLHLLEALQVLQTKIGNTIEARTLSFRSLDIEQIGHVYEGLLDHTAKRATEPMLGLQGTRDKEPEISVSELEKLAAKGEKELLKFLKDETGRSESALKKGWNAELDDQLVSRFGTVCQDSELWKRVKPFAGLVRWDTNGYPVVVTTGSLFVTSGTDRRSSGTHYTPKSLTEPIVQYTLEPLVYFGPAEGLPKEQWKLRSAKELLALKICDMACGSGAFLVQACRYMSARLLEAWDEAVRGVGSGVRGEESNGATELSGTRSLAEGDDARRGMLQAHEDVSQRRTFRDDEPDSASGSVDPGQHRRRSGTTTHERVSELPEHSEGIAQGIGNTSDAQPAGWTDGDGTTSSAVEAHRRDQPHDVGTPKDARTTCLKSPRTPHSTPHLRITPEGQPSTGQPGEMLIPDDPDERQTYALRIVAQRCLYGVDINPLAVEMAKLSLWLLTLAKDKPFEFLDHAIRCGDSLVGIHKLDQLHHFDLSGKPGQTRIITEAVQNRIKETVVLRRQIEEMQANTVDDVETQDRLLREANEKIDRLKYAADLLISAEFVPGSAADKRAARDDAAIKVAVHFKDSDLATFHREAQKALGGQETFHWPLEFPEVIVERGGFDAFVGNPPFMGGLKISEHLGSDYRKYLVAEFSDNQKGAADLCAYFILGGARLLRRNGMLGFLTTASIGQGETREIGLERLLSENFVLPRAVSGQKWTGTATVEISLIWLRNGDWLAKPQLDGQAVDSINSYLGISNAVDLTPRILASNAGKSFQGNILLGTGFAIDIVEAQSLLAHDKRNHEVVFPYLIGRDLNTTPDQSPQRFVIQFDERSEEEAKSYGQVWKIIEQRVKPERITKDAKKYPRMVLEWWKHWNNRQELSQAVAELSQVLVKTKVSNTWAFCFVPNGLIYDQALIVFATAKMRDFAVLQSTIHFVWADHEKLTMRTDMQYVPTRCFEPFPLPADLAFGENCSHTHISSIGTRYHKLRAELMRDRQEGLTKTYNRFHSDSETSDDIQKLRQLHVEMDNAVAAAYGWTDLDLGHGFHETKQGIRYTISEPARREVLARLLKLNHERYAEEVKQGLHDKKKGSGVRGQGSGKTKTKKGSGPGLFGEEDA